MARDFVTQVISRAVHEEIFRQLLQNDAQAAADAMDLAYDGEDLRTVQAIHDDIDGLDSDAAREYLQGLAQQTQGVFGSPQRPE